MKKLLGIVVLGLLWSNLTFAEFKDNPIYKNKLTYFNKWLYDNGHHQYLNLNPESVSYKATAKNKKDPLTSITRTHMNSKATAEADAMEACKLVYEVQGKEMQEACYIHSVINVNDPCKTEPKFSQVWYYNECNIFRGTTNLNITGYKSHWGIPFNKSPNRDTLIYYLYKNLYSHDTGDTGTKQYSRYEIQPSKNPYEFKSELKENKFIKKQMLKKPLLSYLFFEDGKIVIDEITPKDKFGEFVDNTTKLRSNSMGKSLVAYVAGHAICAGYIDSVETKIDDWPLLKNTLYDGQKLIDILNMNAGDQKYIFNSTFWDGTEADVELFALNMEKMKGKKKTKSKYNYNAQNTNLIFNYVLYKSKDEFEKLLNDIFQKKARIKDSVYFFRSSGLYDKHITRPLGDANSMFFASRYDYLRISKAILDDWQNDTCVGKYLKTIYKNKIKKNLHDRSKFRVEEATTSYGGQFHLDIIGMKKRKILGMGGYGGQQILIDVEKSKIVVLNSLAINRNKYNYNWKKMVYDVIK